MSKRFFSFLTVGMILFFGLIGFSKTALAHWYVDSNGRLLNDKSGKVLGEENQKEEKEKESRKEKNNVEEVEKTMETKEDKDKDETEDKEVTEIKEKAETEAEKTTIKLIGKEGKIIIRTEGKDSVDIEEDDNQFEIEERADKNKIKVMVDKKDQMMVSRNNVTAKTILPISVDLDTNELIVTTAAGNKVVAILPDQAIANIMAASVIDKVKGVSAQAVAELLLEEKTGEPVYKIKGVSEQKLLGFIPVTVETTALVSATTGELVTSQKTFLNSLVDLISF